MCRRSLQITAYRDDSVDLGKKFISISSNVMQQSLLQ